MIYLDNSATTKPLEEVMSAFVKASEQFYGNPSSLHGFGQQSAVILRKAREQIAQLLKVEPDEVLFTSGGTESNNTAINGIAMKYKNRGRHIITSCVEHPSVSEPMDALERNGFEITRLPVDADGVVSPADVKRSLRKDTILVSIMHVNNETGSIQPLEEIGSHIKNHSRAFFHVDAVQSIGKVPFSIEKASIDLLSLSAHKFHGVKGAGILMKRMRAEVEPLLLGGGQESSLRSGTENTPAIIAMAKALRIQLENPDAGKLRRLQEELRRFFEHQPGVTIISPSGHAPHILNVSVPGLRGEIIVQALQSAGIYVSTTSACSSKRAALSKTLLAMKRPHDQIKGSIRISLSRFSTEEEITVVQKAWQKEVMPLMEVVKTS